MILGTTDLTEIKAGIAAGNVTVEKVTPQTLTIPVPEEQIKITKQRWNPNTGEEVEPVVQIIRKQDLLSERKGLEAQAAQTNARIAAIDELLQAFEPVTINGINLAEGTT